MSKLTEEQLKELQGAIGKVNNFQMQLGGIELQKHELLHGAQQATTELQAMQAELEKEYGKVSVNIQDGSYEAIEDEPSKED